MNGAPLAPTAKRYTVVPAQFASFMPVIVEDSASWASINPPEWV
jgi:hypothetical protein